MDVVAESWDGISNVHYLMHGFSILSHKATATPAFPNAAVAMKWRIEDNNNERVCEVEHGSSLHWFSQHVRDGKYCHCGVYTRGLLQYWPRKQQALL